MKHALLLGVAAAAILSSAAAAQSPTPSNEAGSTANEAPETTSGDIVVTANRREERLVDVPATVTAVTADEVLNLKIFRAEDVAPLSPGLQLRRDGGFAASASLRGLDNTEGGASPTVDFYYNDIPQDPNYAINAIYDIGQIEVLRGPQGTLRGRPSPSGAITITTKRPDLDDIGGYVQGTVTNKNGYNGQGGFSLPLIPGKLAIRVAGLYDETDSNRIRSVNSNQRPSSITTSGRITILAQPVETLQLVATYQHLDVKNRFYRQVTGNGAAAAPALGIAAGYNGPVLASSDRRAISEAPETDYQNGDIGTLQATLELPFNANLIYVGGYQSQKTLQRGPFDVGNSINNFERLLDSGGPQSYWSHEVRLQSDRGRVIDYVVGAFSLRAKSLTNFSVISPLFGAFGLFNPTRGPIDPAFNLNINGNFRVLTKTRGIFGSATVHATDRLDLTAGLRYNFFDIDSVNTRNSASALVTAPLAFPCAFAGGTNTRYGVPGFCDIRVNVPGSVIPVNQRYRPLTWNAAVKYGITDEINLYASYGRSFRQGGSNAVSVETHNNPILLALADLPPERSDSYEIGVKGSLLDRKLRVSAAVFQQDFENQQITVRNVAYLGNTNIQSRDLIYAADSRIRGFEFELAGNPTRDLDFVLTAAYARGKLQNAQVICRDGNGDGVADTLPVGSGTPGKTGEAGASAAGNLTEAKPVAFCNSNGRTSTSPRFTATLQSEYRVPFGENTGYVRALATYRGKAIDEQNAFTADDFLTVNLFAGVRIGDTTDVSIFARNLFNADVETFRASTPYAAVAQLPVSTGYFQTRRNLPRELGLSARFQFGSR